MFMNLDANYLASLDPCTHIYQFDTGFPPNLLEKLAQLFNTSEYAIFLISYNKPSIVIDDYKYNVEIQQNLGISLHGSNEKKTVYFYKKKVIPPSEMPPYRVKLTLPQRLGIDEEPIEIFCDPSFLKGIEIAVGPPAGVSAYLNQCVDKFTNGPRPKRVWMNIQYMQEEHTIRNISGHIGMVI